MYGAYIGAHLFKVSNIASSVRQGGKVNRGTLHIQTTIECRDDGLGRDCQVR